MRVCMIASTPFPPQEGIGFYVWNLAKQLRDRGHEVQIITRGSAARTHRAVVDGICIWWSTFVPTYPFHVHLHSLWVDRLVKQLEDEVDVFHLHTPLVKRPATKRPFLVTVHTPMKADVAAVTTDTLLGRLIKLQAPISYRLEQELFDHAAGLTAVSHSVAGELSAYGIDPKQVKVLGNGVDTDLFMPPQHENGYENGQGAYPANGHSANGHSANGHSAHTQGRYALTVARLAPRKGVSDLIQCAEIVAKQDPSFRFLIAGSGPLENDLRAEISRRNLSEQVTLLGHIDDRAQLVDLYRHATVFVHPAHYEGLPTVLLEAMACARPTVTTAVSGALDVIDHEKNGLLVPPHAPQKMAESILRLLNQPETARQMGAAARQTIEERYSWRIVSENYLNVFEDVI